MTSPKPLAVTRAPDLIVLDPGLPDGDGKTVSEPVRAFSDVPIIVLPAGDQNKHLLWHAPHDETAMPPRFEGAAALPESSGVQLSLTRRRYSLAMKTTTKAKTAPMPTWAQSMRPIRSLAKVTPLKGSGDSNQASA